MTADPLTFDAPLLLLGGGPVAPALLADLAARTGWVVAADGGADRLHAGPLRPAAVIGDMDSLSHRAEWEADPAVQVIEIAEQDSTDFEKCLRLTRAPLTLAAGFLGGRFDHSLAALHALMRFPERRVILVGDEDIAFLAPLDWRARLAPGARVSIWPIAPVRGIVSAGLEWPLRDLDLAAGSVIGTSNRAVAEQVAVCFDRRAAAVMVERRFLDAVAASLGA